MARKPAKPYHHGGLREALAEAGILLIEAEGLSAFTLRECARRAGVSHAAPKNHFATAEDLLAEIAARGYDRFVASLGKAADRAVPQSADARLIAMGQAYVAFARAHPGVYGLMFRNMKDRAVASGHLDAARQAAWTQLHDGVAAVIGPGRGDAAVKSAHVWALVHGIASLIIDKRLPPPLSAAAVIKESLASLPAALRSVG